MKNSRTAVVLSAVLLAACGKPGNKAVMPSSPNLKTLYIQSCYSCHSRGTKGAPRSGNAEDWRPRLEKGMDTLLQHTAGGFKAMPAKGMCGSCSREDYRALITFMATPHQTSPDAAEND